MHLFLDQTKERTRSTQTLVNSGLYWIKVFTKGNSFTTLYCLSKKLNIPPISAKYAIAQVRCYKNGKTQNVLSLIYLEIYLVVDVMHGIKKVKF